MRAAVGHSACLVMIACCLVACGGKRGRASLSVQDSGANSGTHPATAGASSGGTAAAVSGGSAGSKSDVNASGANGSIQTVAGAMSGGTGGAQARDSGGSNAQEADSGSIPDAPRTRMKRKNRRMCAERRTFGALQLMAASPALSLMLQTASFPWFVVPARGVARDSVCAQWRVSSSAPLSRMASIAAVVRAFAALGCRL